MTILEQRANCNHPRVSRELQVDMSKALTESRRLRRRIRRLLAAARGSAGPAGS